MKIIEWCPYCGDEVEIEDRMDLQECPNCGNKILPCSLCDHDKCDCGECPFKKNKKQDYESKCCKNYF